MRGMLIRGYRMHKTDFTSDPVDRRKFIAGSAGVSAAVVAAALTSCAPANQGAAAGSSSNGADQSDGAVADEPSASAAADSAQESSTVYVTRDISPDGLRRAFDALGVAPHGNAAVKLSTGEPGGHNFLSPDLIGGLVQGLGATIVECNTDYDGSALIERMESRNGAHTLEHAEAIGLGSQTYELVDLDA